MKKVNHQRRHRHVWKYRGRSIYWQRCEKCGIERQWLSSVCGSQINGVITTWWYPHIQRTRTESS